MQSLEVEGPLNSLLVAALLPACGVERWEHSEISRAPWEGSEPCQGLQRPSRVCPSGQGQAAPSQAPPES